MKKVIKFFINDSFKTVEEMTIEEKQEWIKKIESRINNEIEYNQKNDKKLLKVLRG